MAKARPAAVENFERQIIRNDQEVVKEWAHYLDAPGAPALEGEVNRWAMARILDNSARALKTMEATQTTSVFGSNYLKALLGMSRQVFPRLMGTGLVSVQPVDRPTAQIFYLNLKRDDGSTLGRHRKEDRSDLDSAALLASRTYADHGTQDSSPAPGEGEEIEKSMSLSIDSQAIQIGKGKKLRTGATLELVQDLQAYHDLNALDLLQGAATDEIAQEIDAMIVKAVHNAAVAHKTVTFGTTAPEGWTQNEWRHRLQRAILLADQHVYLASGRRPNVLVAGPQAYLELADLSTFKLNPSAEMDSGNYGLVPVGTLANQYTVMLSRHIPDNEILLARKGDGFLDAGIVYAPYVALFVSERVFNVVTQTTEQSFASRFGIFTMSNTLYARVVIDEEAEGIA